MQKIALIVAALVLGGPAFAGAPVAPTWTGFYIGGNVGGVSGRDTGTTYFIDPHEPTIQPQGNSFADTSAIGGIQAGYNWQVTQWVLGVEADWDWTDTKNGFCRQTDFQALACSDNSFGFLTFKENTEWLGSERGRLGYAWDRFMVYGTGGVAWGRIDTSINANCLAGGCATSAIQLNTTANFSDTRVGWVAGFGLEDMLNANWLVRAEYLHYDLGSVTDTLNLPGLNGGIHFTESASWSHAFTYDSIRAGLSYKFN
jgi:outer membrane immunogenic protein